MNEGIVQTDTGVEGLRRQSLAPDRAKNKVKRKLYIMRRAGRLHPAKKKGGY